MNRRNIGKILCVPFQKHLRTLLGLTIYVVLEETSCYVTSVVR
jgi:hypothetical protein